MSDVKKLKDPIYGYISIDSFIVENIIDTAEFQRLRGITQTSYAPLFSSAVHNRFVHSLGVYYLGTLVATNIIEYLKKEEKIEQLDRCIEIFQLACLLHDLGHAPFSHTGEDYYLDNGDRKELHAKIVSLTKDNDLKAEISSRNYKIIQSIFLTIQIIFFAKFD